MLSVISDRPAAATVVSASCRSDHFVDDFSDSADSQIAAGRGLARAALIGLGCWIVVGAAAWTFLF